MSAATSTGIKAIGKFILVAELEKGRRKTASGIILNEFKDSDAAARSRWARVLSVGPKAKGAGDLKPGEWVLVSYNRWTPGMQMADGVRINAVDDDAILIVSDERPDIDLLDAPAEGGYTDSA